MFFAILRHSYRAAVRVAEASRRGEVIPFHQDGTQGRSIQQPWLSLAICLLQFLQKIPPCPSSLAKTAPHSSDRQREAWEKQRESLRAEASAVLDQDCRNGSQAAAP